MQSVPPAGDARQIAAASRDPDPMLDDTPDYRLCVRRGTVRAIDWSPWLAAAGPMTMLLAARGRAGVTIADLTVVRDGDLVTEAIVRFLTGDGAGPRAAIAAWARDVGYRRLWLPSDLVQLPGPAEGLAETRCGGCAARFADEAPGFWAGVRASGRFPATCPLCGGDLPQWRVKGADPADDPRRGDRLARSGRSA